MTIDSNAMRKRAREILATNDRGGYTVPTARLYPFQWNWDSAFVAMGFATYDVERAYRELEGLAEGQWPDGMIPHIVFHAPSDDYFPGPAVWGTARRSRRGGPPTSGITQPPVFATALAAVDEAAKARHVAGAAARSGTLYRAALAWHRWWMRARDPGGLGLVAILHNWESGSDNSLAWDTALARVPTTTSTEVKRKDTGHVDAAMRPRDEDYARYIHLVDCYRDAGWDADAMWKVAPFKVADVQMTAILARATEDLIALSASYGTPEEQSELHAMHRRLTMGLMAQWSDRDGRFLCRDLVDGTAIRAPSQAGFVPLSALKLPSALRDRIVGELLSWLDGLALRCVPSAPRLAEGFDAKRYWRGPVWAIINWYVIDGLRRNGLEDLAREIESAMVEAIDRAGFAEYYDPVTGEGCGGHSFSWTAAAYLLMSR